MSSTTGVYRRLAPFLRPHVGRLVLSVACNLLAAVFDAFTLALLIPFLGVLFRQPQFGITGGGFVVRVLRERYPTIGADYLRRLARWSVRAGPEGRLTWKWDKRVRGRLRSCRA